MALNCDLDLNLKALQDAKDALKAKLNLPDIDVSALDDIKAKALAQKDALLAAAPTLPKLPDFQGEIDALKAKILAKTPGWDKDLAKLEKQWGNAIDDIQGILDTLQDPTKLLNLDLCSGIPAVEGEMQEDGTFAPKKKPPVAKDATAPPPDGEVPLDKPIDMSAFEVKLEGGASGVSTNQYLEAKSAITDATDAVMKQLDDKIKTSWKAYKKAAKSKDYKKAKKAVPKAFKQQYPGALTFEYYLLESDKVPTVVDDVIYNFDATKNLRDIKIQLQILDLYVKKAFDGSTVEGGQLYWENGKFTTDAFARHLYYLHGFGLDEYGSYGHSLKASAASKEAQKYIPVGFNLKPKDYKAAKVPLFRSVTDLKNGNYETDTNYQNILSDYINAIFDTQYLGHPALVTYGAYKKGVSLSEMDDIPSAQDFIPNTLGGKLIPYEDSLSIVVDTMEELKHSKEGFTPHFMYRSLSVIYAETYEDHVELSRLGYTHSRN